MRRPCRDVVQPARRCRVRGSAATETPNEFCDSWVFVTSSSRWAPICAVTSRVSATVANMMSAVMLAPSMVAKLNDPPTDSLMLSMTSLVSAKRAAVGGPHVGVDEVALGGCRDRAARPSGQPAGSGVVLGVHGPQLLLIAFDLLFQLVRLDRLEVAGVGAVGQSARVVESGSRPTLPSSVPCLT